MKIKYLFLIFLPLLFTGCALDSAEDGQGAKYTSINFMGKKSTALASVGGILIFDNRSDTTEVPKHALNVAGVAYGAYTVGSYGKAVIAGKNARHAADAAAKAAAAKSAAALKQAQLKAGLIEKLGVPGDVGIGVLKLD